LNCHESIIPKSNSHKYWGIYLGFSNFWFWSPGSPGGNYAGKAKFQLGFLAIYATSEANQMSLFGGYAGTTKFQLGIINIVETLEGTQIGLINIAKYSKGCQFGLINLTIKKESGFPLLPIVNCSM
jgi:hypothetical protein